MNSDLAQSRLAEILLVEDNENDVILTREGFRLARLAVNMHHVPDGRQCLAFLRKEGQYEGAPTPDLILLDLNMPVMNGRELLEHIVADENLRHLPIVILTTSHDEGDILSMYKLRASSYIVKPVDFDQLVEVVRQLGEYWFTLVVLPPDKGMSRGEQ